MGKEAGVAYLNALYWQESLKYETSVRTCSTPVEIRYINLKVVVPWPRQ